MRQGSDCVSTNEKVANPPVDIPNSVHGHLQGPEHTSEDAKESDMVDVEPQNPSHGSKPASKTSVYQGLGWLDRLLALWILLAIIVGILLGNYVDSVGPALQRGQFVQVSVPIGMSSRIVSMSSV